MLLLLRIILNYHNTGLCLFWLISLKNKSMYHFIKKKNYCETDNFAHWEEILQIWKVYIFIINNQALGPQASKDNKSRALWL